MAADQLSVTADGPPPDPRPAGCAPPRGLFVAVEGVDRSGKTTLVRGLAGRLCALGWRVGVRVEPSGGPVGRAFRVLSRTARAPAPCYALLSAADRLDQQAALGGELASCEVVLADRYYLSGLAYHAADGIDSAFYASLNPGVLLPDVYLLLDVDPAVAAGRGGPPDGRWEAPGIATRLRAAYESGTRLLAEDGSCRVLRLDANRPATDVLAAAADAVAALLGPTPARPPAGKGTPR